MSAVRAPLRLQGCAPEPLAGYLKALGVLRIVAEQVDPSASGCWDGDRFVLTSTLDAEGLVSFFVHRYAPSPVLSPWNKDAGFPALDASSPFGVILGSSDPRLGPYRHAIARAAEIVEEEARSGDVFKDPLKSVVIERCRAELPDEAVAYLDAAVVLTSSASVTSPLFGTGGNDGRLEFSKIFAGHLVVLFGLGGRGARRRAAPVEDWCRAALLDEGRPALTDEKIGQFDPGAVGGANSGPLGDAGALVNPWDYVLAVEGAILFGAGVARRFGAVTEGRAAIPFMVEASPVGYSTGAAGEASRGELWLPVWSKPASRSEVARLLAEGRAEWRGRQARTGLDFVRAATTLAVDRGIDGFVRTTFVDRHGRQTLAVSAGRVQVVDRSEARVTASLDPWVGQIRRVRDLPAAVASALRTFDTAVYRAAAAGGPQALQAVLVALAALEGTVARSGRMRTERVPHPFTDRLDAVTWLPLLDDGTAEVRIAAAMASQGDAIPRAGSERHLPRWRFAHYLRPVAPARPRETWSDVLPVAGLGARPLVEVLSDVLRVRSVDVANRGRSSPEPATGDAANTGVEPVDDGPRGLDVAFPFRTPARIDDVVAFLLGDTDDRRVEELLGGLLMLDWVGARATWTSDTHDALVPPALAVLGPFFQPPGQVRLGTGRLRPGADWAALLASGRAAEVIDDALRRLRMARRIPIVGQAAVMARTVPEERLAAALLIPISPGDTRALIQRVSLSQEQETMAPVGAPIQE